MHMQTHTDKSTFLIMPISSHDPPPTPPPHTHPSPCSLCAIWLALREPVEMSGDSAEEFLPVCFWLGVKQITLCMHEYITSAAVIIPGKASAFGTCALLPSWLLRHYCHCHTIKWVWMLTVRVSTGIRCFFICWDSWMFLAMVWGRAAYMMKHSENWNCLAKTFYNTEIIIL